MVTERSIRMHMGNEVVMDRCRIMSVEIMPSVLPVESNVCSTLKQGDPLCENSGTNAALRAVLAIRCQTYRMR